MAKKTLLTAFSLLRLKKYCIVFLISAIATFLLQIVKLHPAEPQRNTTPNILLIIVDTLRADYLSCYGNKEVKTPNIDKLATEGIKFSRAVAHVPLTLPSHASIFTSTYPLYHGVRDNGYFHLEDRFITLAEILKQQGYQTAAFVGAFPVDSRFGIAQGFDLYDDYYGEGSAFNDFAYAERPAEEVIKPAMKWLKNSSTNKPWFCWLHFYDPHMPYIPPAPFDQLHPDNPYAGEVAYTDIVIGQFFKFLGSNSLDENLVIIFTSDHGEGLGDHGESTHGIFAYNSTLNVPLIFWHKKIFPQPKTISKRVRHIDISPTILDILNIHKPSQMQGRSLIPLIRQPSNWQVDESYFETFSANLNRYWAPLQGIFSLNYKYIRLPIPELYDMNNDLQEESNIYEQRPAVAHKMIKRLSDLIKSSLAGSLEQIKPIKVDEETRAKLLALGYLTPTSKAPPKKTYTEEDDPKNLIELNEMLNQAISFHLQKKIQASIKLLKNLIDKRPDFPLAYTNLAYIQHQSGRLEDAVDTLQKAVDRGIKDIPILSKLGLHLQEAGHLQRSRSILESAAKQDPKNFEVLNYLGVTLYRLKDYEKAKDIYNKLLAIDPSFAPAYNNLGSISLAQRDYQKAISYLKKAINFDPHSSEANNGLGVAYANLNQPEEAINYWKKAVEFDPKKYDTLYNLGILLTRMERYEEAIPYLQQFANDAPDYKYQDDIKKVRKLIELLKSRH